MTRNGDSHPYRTSRSKLFTVFAVLLMIGGSLVATSAPAGGTRQSCRHRCGGYRWQIRRRRTHHRRHHPGRGGDMFVDLHEARLVLTWWRIQIGEC